MFSGVIRSFQALSAVALVAASTLGSSATAIADPGQDQRFFDLLGQKDIPPVDNANSLITSARHACEKLDGGMPVGDLVELVRTNGFNENPLTRLQPQDRITRTIDQFINAAVEAYCPYNKGKIASIAGYETRSDAAARITLVSYVEPLPDGEINPTKPLPVPAQTPPPLPQEIPPVPLQPPPPPRHAPPAPKQAPPPPPEQPPPPAEEPQAPPPEAAPPAPAAPGSGGNGSAPDAPGGGGNAPVPGAPGGGTGGGRAPAPQTPDQPSPPGHIRLAP